MGRVKKAPKMPIDALDAMLARLKLGAIRDQLDSLLDEAARMNLSARDTLVMLCERELARKDQLGICAVVDGTFQAIDVEISRHADDRSSSADDLVSDTDYEGATTAIRHADDGLEHQCDRVLAAARVPFLEVERLTLEVVSHDVIKAIENCGDFLGRRHCLGGAGVNCSESRSLRLPNFGEVDRFQQAPLQGEHVAQPPEASPVRSRGRPSEAPGGTRRLNAESIR